MLLTEFYHIKCDYFVSDFSLKSWVLQNDMSGGFTESVQHKLLSDLGLGDYLQTRHCDYDSLHARMKNGWINGMYY